MRARLLHWFGYVSSLRDDYVEALVVAKRAEALAAVSHDRELMLVACFLPSEAHSLQGSTQATRPWMERGLAIAETLDSSANDVFAGDPRVTLLGMLAIALLPFLTQDWGYVTEQYAECAAAMRIAADVGTTTPWAHLFGLLEIEIGASPMAR